MEALVATAVGPLVSLLMKKASNSLLEKYKVMEGMEEQHRILKRKLPAILDVISDAEEQATAHKEGAKAWLQELKTVAYQASEVFDEFKYEALRREAKKNGHLTKLGFDVIKLLPTHNRIVFRIRMGPKLRHILQSIEALITEMQRLRFNYQPQPPVSKLCRQTDYVIIDPQEIASRSRDKDKKKIVDTLLGQAGNADLAVVPIIGMGGLGKTTLAQLIYNDTKIKEHFQLRLWVCVSGTYDVNSLAKSIVEASHQKNDNIDIPPLDRLQKFIKGQRYLLVLDDVWDREVHKWESLKGCLQYGGMGSAVLTTTRDKQVAEIVDADRSYNLSPLEDRFLKEIIEARAFNSKKEKAPELVEMVDQIVNRCRGSPLAACLLGSVLRTKTTVKEWKAIASRSSICTEETRILPILKLSYNDLPSHMKQCFAFCAIFPKNYKIDVEKLIRLWIANGFIPEQEEDSLETIGEHIFNELASRSFFMDIEKSKDVSWYYSMTTCKIHDLMHDIAMSVMGKECVVVATKEQCQTKWLPDTARHLFLLGEETNGILNDSMEKRFPAIQTLLSDSFVQISKYNSLHALKLCIDVKLLLVKPLGTTSYLLKSKYLHHLRYLDLSESCIDTLPEGISILYNLQVLDLSYCYYLDRLPRQMKYMTSLRHLYTHGCENLKSMPPGLGKLTRLQTLTCFVAAVTSPDCSDIAELHDLNLGGHLELRHLETVENAEAEVASLGNKKDLRELTLRWASVCDRKVLDNFKPHDGLQVLRTYSYGGECMGMLQNMVEIHLFHCERLQFLFRCGTSFTFPKLKVLMLEHMLDLERWWEINGMQEEQIIFPLLEKLSIGHCGKLIALPEAPFLQTPFLQEACSADTRLARSPFPALKVLELKELASFQRWGAVEETREQILFPQLEKLSIQRCPELIDLPEAPKLIILEIEYVKQEIFHWVDRYLCSLTQLTLRLYTGRTSEVDKEKWNKISPITFMNLALDCWSPFFGSGALESWDNFVHLQTLEIIGCDVLVHWPEKVLQSLLSLRKLKIVTCRNLTGYTEAPLESSKSERSQQLPSLESLELKFCANLVEMFDVPASLKRMNISECSKLEYIFGKQQGMSELFQGSSCDEAIMPAAVSESMNHFCPCLEDLELLDCDSLPAVLHLPPSLETIFIARCSSIQVLTCQLDGLQKPQVTASTNVPELPAVAAREHSFPPRLDSLKIYSCDSMLGGILRLPMSLKHLDLFRSNGWISLEPLSAEHPPSLESLLLESCRTLASLPNEPQAYRSLRYLRIKGCAALKKLPGCLQQRLGSIYFKQIAARYEVTEFNPFKPKTWKEIPRVVREWRQPAETDDPESPTDLEGMLEAIIPKILLQTELGR
ncbi:hypothetical protein VPH35_000150 [Triticum aestivum]|uniref:Powdery mildew resistance protein n=1 Tax=Triticum aestivum TaxID=4565 RepID=A0A3B5XTC4_WHEAT|nr:putative disease resistance protein RGA4 [Triticum aestivum]XP_044452765.1 putative disease resistance protein RGA4 [Triticum aestivum]